MQTTPLKPLLRKQTPPKPKSPRYDLLYASRDRYTPNLTTNRLAVLRLQNRKDRPRRLHALLEIR